MINLVQIRKPRTIKLILLAILISAGFLRLWQLDHADVVTDEAFYGTRSLGYLDFLGTQAQGTPSEWYAVRPWWSYLSFHDHPPLVFAVQHLSLRIFGENVWGLRLPSAIAGIATVFLLYLIGRRLKNESTGLIAAALGSVELYLVWPSRAGLQESIMLALVLAAFCFFLKALDNPRWWWATWTAYAVSVLAKYTVIVFLPIVFTYLLVAHRKTFRQKAFWISQNVQGVITLPLLIYNVALFLDRRHFDLQLSALLGIDVPAWRYLPGKEIGTLDERIANFLPTLWQTASPIILAAAALAVVALVFQLKHKTALLILLGIGWTKLLLLMVGPSPRFFVLLVPWLLLAIGWCSASAMQHLPQWGKPLFIALLLGLIGYGGYFSWVNTFSTEYFGGNKFAFSILRRESGSFGYQGLDAVLAREVDAFRPAQPATVQYPVLQRQIENGVARDQGKPEKALLIAFDADLAWPTPLWYFIRRTIYHGWTAVSTDGLKTALEEGRFAALVPEASSTQILLVSGNTLLERSQDRTESVAWFVEQLQLASSTPTAVVGDPYNPRFTLWTVPAKRLRALAP